jgi:hypothetical protein
MLPFVEIRDLTREQADERAQNATLSAQTVEIIAQPDGNFTVRATYAAGTIIPGATGTVEDDSAPFALTGLNQSEADEESALFRDSGAAVAVAPEAGDRFTVHVTPLPPPDLVEPPAPVAPNAPDLDGYVFCLDRIRTERRAGFGYDRTVSTYQAYFNRAPVAGISGMAVERQGPGDNGQSGVDNHRRIAAGTYPLFTHAGLNSRYKTLGYATPGNPPSRPWPCVGVENTGARSGILIHCASGYLMSIGCINLTSNVANANTNLFFPDSWRRVTALIDSIRTHLGASFPHNNNVGLPETRLVIREHL